LKTKNDQESIVITDSSVRNARDSSVVHVRDVGDTPANLSLLNQKK